MPDLGSIRRAIVERSAELDDALTRHVAERELLREVLGVLEAGGHAPGSVVKSPRRPRARGRGTPRASRTSRPKARRANRSDEALRLIGGQPGITPAGLGVAMRIKPQYLYRVLPGLVKAGKLIKRGHGYVLAEPATD